MNITAFARHPIVRFITFWLYYIGVGLLGLYALVFALQLMTPGPTIGAAAIQLVVIYLFGPIGMGIFALGGYMYALAQETPRAKIIISVISTILLLVGVWAFIITRT